MNTILLFSRCQLVDLYGSISSDIEKKYKVIHVAYSDEEEKILKEKYAIKQVVNFKKEISKILLNDIVTAERIIEIDTLIIAQSDNRFSLNASIQADRTFEYLRYDECLKLTVAYYLFWKKIIIEYNIKYLVHEPTSLMFNQIAALLCKKLDSKYLTQIQVYGESSHNWIIVTGDDGKPEEIIFNLSKSTVLTEIDKNRVSLFLNKFRGDSTVFFGKYSKGKVNLKRVLQASIRSVGSFFKRRIARLNLKSSLINHVEIFTVKSFSLFGELKKQWGAYLFVKYDDFNPDLNFYYYPLHCEPEAVVLYWGDSIYKNQVKLIENIAAQLPPNCFLYVKDHPHVGFYREVVDYERIKAIPNVKLLDPATPGKSIIRKSSGVITINGTSGFEALLLNKRVYTFGNAFYSSFERVIRIQNIRDLRENIYLHHGETISDDEALIKFLHSYLNSIHKGFTDYFINFTDIYNIDKSNNAKIVSAELLDCLEKITVND